ncbi:MAG: S-layer homology domain-containing protein [Oscillospiraceae bacterium]|jgi:alpha-tubulin suppressor-like RCC1 family protein|nr:S-layer homology domain-containing protein [Oscillospiraceae bacterium]
MKTLKRTLAMTLAVIMLMCLLPLTATASPIVPGQETTYLAGAQVFTAPNGDGYTPYNLRWEINEYGDEHMHVDGQAVTIVNMPIDGTQYGFEVLKFRNGAYIGRQFLFSTIYEDGNAKSAHLYYEDSGEYVFIARSVLLQQDAYFGTGATTIVEYYGQWAKSPTKIVGDGGATTPTNPTTPPTSGTLSLPVGRMVTTISGGMSNSFAIKDDGSLWGWGTSVGDGTANQYDTPKKIMDGVSAVSAGHIHTMAVKTDGTLWAWGSNENGQLGNGTTTMSRSPVKIMDGVSAVSAGYDHTLILKTDGSVWACGSNVQGQIGNGSTAYISNPVTTPVRITDNVAAVSAGAFYSMILKKDGSVWTWGSGNDGRLGYANNTEQTTPKKVMDGAVAVYAGGMFGAAIKTDGSLWTWGANQFGQLGDGKGGPEQTRATPAKVMDGVSSAALSTFGEGYMMILKTDGSLWACGANGNGEYGNGTTTYNRAGTPVKVQDGVAAVTVGMRHTMGLYADGSLWVWGAGAGGRIGNGSNSDQNKPAFAMNGVKLPGGGTAANPLDSAADWAKAGITAAIGKGFVPADIQGSYTNVITRAEFCRLAVRWLEVRLDKNIDAIVAEHGIPERMSRTFSDTTNTDILAAYRLGVTGGELAPTDAAPGRFNPSGQFNREQAATMILNTVKVAGMDVSNTSSAGFNDIGTASSWAVNAINYVRNAGIMSGTGTADNPLFSPQRAYTRQESIVTFNNIG